MRAVLVIAALLCAPLGSQAAVNLVPEHGLRAATHKLIERKAFLQAGIDADPLKLKAAKVNETDQVLQQFNPFAEGKHHESARLMCGITETVGAHTDKYEDCPANCPYFAQNRKDTEHCTFLCVPGNECGRWNPNKPIPDSIKNTKTCRGPMVPFCSEPHLDLTETCKRCQSGYKVWAEDGQCYFKYWTPLLVGSAILTTLFVIVTVWAVDFCCREAINEEAVEKAQEWRSRSKILMPSKRPGELRKPWPLKTNLITTNVAGPGMLLHFNFQLFFIVWPFVCACIWTGIACFHNELFILGTRKFGTPRHNCILVAWGYETQQRLMWTKVLFLAIVYVGSFISFLLFSVRQLRIYQRLDAHEKTMKDFALELKGLPELKGENVEQHLLKAVNAATGKSAVGVSVAWNFDDHQEAVEMLTRRDLTEAEAAKTGVAPVDPANEPDPTENMNAYHKWIYGKEKELLGPDEDKEVNVEELLKNMVASESAFVVFDTEEDAEAALKETSVVKFDGTEYGFDSTIELTLEGVSNEPANINWHNFGDTTHSGMIRRFFWGFFTVYVPALLIWFFGFYVPYAISLYYFNYDNGAELPGYYSGIFTIIICGGNATMYVVCDICCDMIGFCYKDTKQVTYMLMYLVACMINVFLDMVVTYYTALKIMVGLDFRTYHGTRLSEIDTFTEQFETYAMQRSLGENTYRYAWPSTFFLCFVLEPFVTILAPWYFGKVIVRTHREIQGACAEAYMMAFEFDLGRYADILLNVFLGILIFYFPGGYIWTLFFAMCFSHCFIYCFDHWRVLNTIPYVKIVSTQVDWWAQVMMCGCCAMIMGCLVFKANCESYVNYCLQDMPLITACSIAGTAHFIVHFLLLLYLVPMLGCNEIEKENEGMKFEAVARKEARTWFSVNPVHCLRSQYLHKNKPHCRLAAWGKEHLLEVNDSIGCYFTDKAAAVEEYGLRKSLSHFHSGLMAADEDDDDSARVSNDGK